MAVALYHAFSLLSMMANFIVDFASGRPAAELSRNTVSLAVHVSPR
jgi:hypothetical protein